MKKISLLLVFAAMLLPFQVFAQSNVTALLIDSSNGDPVGFATVSITKKGQQKALKYGLSTEDGKVKIESVRKGEYSFKAELLGYKPYIAEIKVEDGALNMGTVKMDPDNEMLDAARISAMGNPIVMKKDTIEFNANAFKTAENDVLEDLLKKLPGVEVSEDGTITVNGETIKKITIDGKTFFLDDPQLASKNIPAKAIEKLKVIEKKSEQAEFTGFSDGEEETVIDLSVKPGMMKGMFGNVSAGGGMDIPSANNDSKAFRFQGGGFLGRFNKKSQISVILNGNNTNNRGFNDISGGMMQGMMGGGMGMGRGQGGWGSGNGITTSYMAGVNGAFNLLEDKMSLSGNYLFNGSDKDVWEKSKTTTYLGDRNLIYDSDGQSLTHSLGHRFGIRIDHKFSENTSILFQPQVNFGNGWYTQNSLSSTDRDDLQGNPLTRASEAEIRNSGNNKNVNAGAFLLFRQRLGRKGRTLSLMGNFNFSNNDLDGKNYNNTKDFDKDAVTVVDQFFRSGSRTTSVMARVTYTEPLGGDFFLEANYAYRWNQSKSEKNTFDTVTKEQDYTYSNNIVNISSNHEIGANVMYQKDKISAQLGVAAIPTHTFNSTTKYDPTTEKYQPRTYTDDRWNFSPRAMLWGEFGENSSARLFYFGNTAQPSTSQLMPVPDNTNPLRLTFGNPTLKPYFSHNLRGDYRFSNKKTFTSFNIRFNGGFVQNPIVSAVWYGAGGTQYSMPFNGRTSASAGFNASVNSPIAKSNFSISNMLRMNWSMHSSYVGSNVDMSKYPDPLKDYYSFMDEFIADHKDLDKASDFALNKTNSLGMTERLRLTYRIDNLEVQAGGRTRMNKSWYTISENADNTLTWNNQVSASVNWTWEGPGIGLKSDFDFNWYRGYSTAQPNEYVLNAEITKLLFKKKMTLALRCYDILGQSRNLTVSDNSNSHVETLNNTLGRYIILSLTYRFGNFDSGRGGMRGPGGMMGPPPPGR